LIEEIGRHDRREIVLAQDVVGTALGGSPHEVAY
jgi:hypothetical protein